MRTRQQYNLAKGLCQIYDLASRRVQVPSTTAPAISAQRRQGAGFDLLEASWDLTSRLGASVMRELTVIDRSALRHPSDRQRRVWCNLLKASPDSSLLVVCSDQLSVTVYRGPSLPRECTHDRFMQIEMQRNPYAICGIKCSFLLGGTESTRKS